METMLIKRNLGLDIARMAAIIMVLISHSRHFFTPYADLNFLSINGLLGVELFFVLSGFLIGKIIIHDLVESKKGFHELPRFYLRRWLRTLPAYYFVVGILVLFFKKPLNIESLFFLQNFSSESLNFFPVSWSLAVEEWFYLTIPILIIFLVRLTDKDRGKAFVFWCCFLIIGFSFFRIIIVLLENPSWDFGVRKQIFLRLDSLLLGVLLAGIKFYFNDFYNILFKKNRKKLCLISVLGILYVALRYIFELYNNSADTSLFIRTIMFSLIPVFFGIIICLLESSEIINTRLSTKKHITNVITHISLTSYSVYLVHYEIFIPVINKFNVANNLIISIILWVGSIAVSYLIAHCIYYFIECYFLKIRDNITVKRNKGTYINSYQNEKIE